MELFTSAYRPRTFGEVVGQEIAVEALKRIASSDGVAVRSIFLRGAYGSGKTTLARIFAKALNCSEFKLSGDVCDKCDYCADASSKTSLLYKELDASQVGNVDAIRNLSESLSVVPPGRRLVVIDEIHAASTQALNCLLKLVEDGVTNTIFMFCSTEDILPTLKSRSLCLDITPVPIHQLTEYIMQASTWRGPHITEEQARFIAVKSAGHVRDALQLLQLVDMVGDKALTSPYATLRSFILNTLMDQPKKEPLALLEELMRYPIRDIKDSIAEYIRVALNPEPGSTEEKLSRMQFGMKLFSYFFSPVSQQAFRSEVGIELVLRGFYEKYHNKGSE